MTLLESLNSHSGSRVAVSKVKGLESGFIVQLYQKHAITGLLFETKKRERETSKGIRPLRLSGMLSDGLSYKCSIENLPWVGYRRVSVTSSHEFLPHAAQFFFPSLIGNRNFGPRLPTRNTSRQNINISSIEFKANSIPFISLFREMKITESRHRLRPLMNLETIYRSSSISKTQEEIQIFM